MFFAVTSIFHQCPTKQDVAESVNSSLLEEYIRNKNEFFLSSMSLGISLRNKDVGMMSSPVSKVSTRNALDHETIKDSFFPQLLRQMFVLQQNNVSLRFSGKRR